MDPSFEKVLLEYGVGKAVVQVLQSQKIFSVRIFRAMKEEHIVGLLKCDGMSIGSHALLWEMWEEYACSPPVRSFDKVAVSSPRPGSSLSTASSSSSLTTTPPEDRKELFKRYQMKMKEIKKSKKVDCKISSKNINIHLGGMIYDDDLQKGVKKRFIPPPVNVPFPSTATYDDLIKFGKETFFPDESPLDTFCLCDSSGTMFKVEDHSSWVLSEFVQNSGQPPSKIRLYVTWRPMEEYVTGTKDDKNDSDVNNKPIISDPPPLINTSGQEACVMQNCIECDRQFRTYIPGVDTVMPDGSSFFYSTPQQLCPACDESNWGWQWNQDLFPEFVDRKV